MLYRRTLFEFGAGNTVETVTFNDSCGNVFTVENVFKRALDESSASTG
jgi:hypothetical protein